MTFGTWGFEANEPAWYAAETEDWKIYELRLYEYKGPGQLPERLTINLDPAFRPKVHEPWFDLRLDLWYNIKAYLDRHINGQKPTSYMLFNRDE